MECSKCHRPMTALFITYVCDWCDGLKTATFPYRGYVVWRGTPDPGGRDLYVFATADDAERYREACELTDHEVREVWSEEEIIWHTGRGSIRNLTLARHLYTVFPDHRFAPGPHRARLGALVRCASLAAIHP